MVTEADWKNWRSADFEPFLDVVFEAFGPGSGFGALRSDRPGAFHFKSCVHGALLKRGKKGVLKRE